MRKMYPSYLIDKQVKRFLRNGFSTNHSNSVKEIKITFYYKLLYIDSFSINTKKKSKSYVKAFCKNSSINIVFSPFKTDDFFSSKDCLLSGLISFNTSLFVQNANTVTLVQLNVIYLRGLMSNW